MTKILISESQYNMLCEEKEEFFVPRRTREEREKFWRAAIYKKIQRYIKNGSTGDLNLRNSPVLLLPDNLIHVGGHLDLSHTQITKLPDNLTRVGGNLNLSRAPITKLPDNLTVSGYLDLFRCTKITKLPDNLTYVGGFLDLSYTPITKLPDNLTVDGDLYLEYSLITEIPKNLMANRDLWLHGTPLSDEYTRYHILDMITKSGGSIKGTVRVT